MSNNMRVFIPHNFKIVQGSLFNVGENCNIIENATTSLGSYNKVVSYVEGITTMHHTDIYVEMSKAEFFDRLDSAIDVREALLL